MKLISFKSLVLIFNLLLSTTSSQPLESVRKNWTFMLEMVQIKIFYYYYILLLYVLYTGIIHWSPRIQGILSCGKLAVQQTQEFSHNYLISLLIKGSIVVVVVVIIIIITIIIIRCAWVW